MTFASALGLILISLFGLGVIVGALNAKRLIAWENRALTSLADNLRDYRLSLEEEQCLLGPDCALAELSVQLQPAAKHSRHGNHNRAA